MARENDWGYTRILGELKKLGVPRLSRTTVRSILREHGLEPAPQRPEPTWDEFLNAHVRTLWAWDFVIKRIWTPRAGVNAFVPVFLSVATRRVFGLKWLP